MAAMTKKKKGVEVLPDNTSHTINFGVGLAGGSSYQPLKDRLGGVANVLVLGTYVAALAVTAKARGSKEKTKNTLLDVGAMAAGVAAGFFLTKGKKGGY